MNGELELSRRQESDILMQCLEHNLQVAIDRLQELKKSAARITGWIELSQDRAIAIVDVSIDNECAPIIN